jgi:hypothetical protein
MRLHLCPLGVVQHISVHPKLESQYLAWGNPKSQQTLEQDITLIAVIEISQSSWLVAGIVPGIERHPLKKLEPDEAALLRLLWRWRDEVAQKGCH